MKRFFLIALVCVLASMVHAQDIAFYPGRNIGYFYTQNRYNPGAVGQDSATFVGFSNQSFLGLFSGIGSQHVFGQGAIKVDDVKHGFGGYVLREKRGPFINRTRVYGQYAYHLRLNKTYWAAFGAGVGYFQFNLKGSNVAAADADGALDGHVGVRVYGPRLEGGVAVLQVTQPTVVPYSTQFDLVRYFNGDLHLREPINDMLSADFHALFRFSPDQFNDLSLSAGARLNGLITGGINWASQLGPGVYAGLDEFRVLENRLMLSVFYQVHNQVASSMLEIVARYKFPVNAP